MKRSVAILIGGFVGVFAALFFHRAPRASGDANKSHAEVLAKEPVAAAAETVFVHDTVVLHKVIVKYDSSSARYKAARDTLDIKDTTQVRGTLAKADTAIADADHLKTICDTTVKHAGVALFTRKDVDAAVKRENEEIRRLIPGKLDKTVTALKWSTVGAGLGVLVCAVLCR